LIDLHIEKTLQGTGGASDRFVLQVQTAIDGGAGGAFIALFGPSGSGKTTLLRILAGLTKPDAGRIVVNGKVWFDSQQRIDLPPQRRSIGFMFQDYALFPNLTVRENVGYALGPQDRTWLDELLSLTGLEGMQQRLPDSLSGGQKQRVALVRAIARKPQLLLLDEPLSALDIDMRVQLQEELARLQRSFGFTALMVSHDLGEVFKLAQQVLRLEQGRLVQSGTPAQVFLSARHAGKLHVRAQVLEIRREDVVNILSLLVGAEIVDVIASDDEVSDLKCGDLVTLSAKAFSPLIFR
jgi:molybdate transport system ATP-binding protein